LSRGRRDALYSGGSGGGGSGGDDYDDDEEEEDAGLQIREKKEDMETYVREGWRKDKRRERERERVCVCVCKKWGRSEKY
jgi:hypothetical protein